MGSAPAAPPAPGTPPSRFWGVLSGESRIWVLAAGMVAAATVLAPGLVGAQSLRATSLALPWWSLVIAFAVAEATIVTLRLRRESIAFSLSEIPLIIGFVFADPLTVIVARLAGSAIALIWRRQAPLKLCFNLASFALEGVLAALAWHAVLAGSDPLGARSWLAVLAVVAVTDVVSTASVTWAMSLVGGQTSRATVIPALVSGSIMAFTNGSFAVIIVGVLAGDWRVGWALVVVITVLFSAYRSYSSLRRRHDLLEHLTAFTPALDADLSIAAIAADVVARVRAMLDAEVVELVLDPAGDDAGVYASYLPRGLQVTPHSSPTRSGLLGATDQAILAPRGSRAHLAGLERAGLRDAAVAPLVGDQGVSGTLLVGDCAGAVDTFDAEALQVLQTLANHAAVALANSRLAERLRRQAAVREYQALHDALTGLGNRAKFQTQVRERIERGGGPFAVFLLDLDRFKEVNDTLGHHTGDILLTLVGRHIVEALPGAPVARLGGDEFAVLIDDADDVEAARTAEALLAALSVEFLLRDVSVHVRASIGIALHPDNGSDVEVLIQRADVAMYTAKAAGTGFELYSADADRYSPRRLALVGELRHAIDTGGLNLHFQPKVDLSDGTLRGVEALVRWRHPRHGPVGPDEFIPLAEQTGLMRPLTLFVLRSALEQRAMWASLGLDIGVAVNLSPRSLLEPSLVDDVTTILRETGTRPAALTLEITEGSLIVDPVRAKAVLDELSRLGVALSIDDFGTGYSSLSYLWKLPVDELKIDRSFVMSMADEPDAASIVQGIVDLGRRLGKRVVAEGVEDLGTWRRLQRAGCDVAQGFWMGRPMVGADVAGWILDWTARDEWRSDVIDEQSMAGPTLVVA